MIPLYKKNLLDGGFLAFEIGYDQAQSIKALADLHGLECTVIKDYSGNDRVAVLRK